LTEFSVLARRGRFADATFRAGNGAFCCDVSACAVEMMARDRGFDL
jgi:hypothetical protein